MKIDVKKLDLLLARKCMVKSDLRDGSSPSTLRKISRGEEVKPATAGRIAKALGVDPADILEEE